MRVLGCMLANLLAACSSTKQDLFVEVRTDMVPGIEFTSVRTTLLAGAGTSAGEETIAVTNEYTV